MKIFEMSEERFKSDIGHSFMPPLLIAKGYVELAIKNEKDEEQMERMRTALEAINRIEKVAKNMIEKSEIHE